jgi:transposase
MATADGYELLDELLSEDSPEWLRQIPAVETLRTESVGAEFLLRRTRRRRVAYLRGRHPALDAVHQLPHRPGLPLRARKSTTSWVGYRVHLTETCEDDLPNIVIDVHTAPAPVADGGWQTATPPP